MRRTTVHVTRDGTKLQCLKNIQQGPIGRNATPPVSDRGPFLGALF
jgi:hypothetical protein